MRPEEGVVRHGGSVDERRDRMGHTQASFCMQSQQSVDDCEASLPAVHRFVYTDLT